MKWLMGFCLVMPHLDKANIAASREKIRQYIEKLAAAGQKDKRKLAKYGLAYMKELHEGRSAQLRPHCRKLPRVHGPVSLFFPQ
jgi:hypothetical protein